MYIWNTQHKPLYNYRFKKKKRNEGQKSKIGPDQGWVPVGGGRV
jgi:hypothetical protein